MKDHVKGFTVIEALVVMVIVSILASVAYPSYVSQMRKSFRTEAATELVSMAQAQEQFFSRYRTYTSVVSAPETCVGPACGLQKPSGLSENEYYTLTANGDATSYTVTATAYGTQTDDLDCSILTVDNVGLKAAKNASNQDTSDICW